MANEKTIYLFPVDSYNREDLGCKTPFGIYALAKDDDEVMSSTIEAFCDYINGEDAFTEHWAYVGQEPDWDDVREECMQHYDTLHEIWSHHEGNATCTEVIDFMIANWACGSGNPPIDYMDWNVIYDEFRDQPFETIPSENDND